MKTGSSGQKTQGKNQCVAITLRQSAHAVVGSQIAKGASLYRRAIHLPRLLPTISIDPGRDPSAITEEICKRLTQAIASERRRGQTGHWSYSLNRHIALLQALRAERKGLTGPEKMRDDSSGETSHRHPPLIEGETG